MASSVVDAPYSVLLVNGTTAFPASGAKFLLGFVNLDKAAQTATLAVIDNTGASTPGLPQIAALGASQVISYPAPGLPVNGISVTASTTLTGPGVAVLYRANAG
jgi:hypothetical protein